jgi:hypothetical protein
MQPLPAFSGGRICCLRSRMRPQAFREAQTQIATVRARKKEFDLRSVAHHPPVAGVLSLSGDRGVTDVCADWRWA